uniref:Uncharacterized protein n=1 Tax=viral metagenome TaxID=1070528 RepID=A0A6M3MEX6_9ZZZZ
MEFVILSSGAYSDYDPIYYYGGRKVEERELKEVGRRMGDELLEWFEGLPNNKVGESYDPDTGEIVDSHRLGEKWFKKMEVWLIDNKYKRVPDGIPELNASYSDFPHN